MDDLPELETVLGVNGLGGTYGFDMIRVRLLFWALRFMLWWNMKRISNPLLCFTFW